ncbi:MAG: hypothetical protein U1C71_03065, partial [archaeon]|nr:hypothetical protein [archaeon]
MAFTAPKIQDILIPDFQRVAHDAPVTSLYTALGKSKGVPALVFKGKDFAGLVTASELLRNVNASRTKVSTLLRKTPSLKFSDSLETAIHLMRDADVR